MARSVTKPTGEVIIKPTDKESKDIVATAIERFQTIHTRDSHNRTDALEDFRFAYNVDGGQWPNRIRSERTAHNRPILTSNKLRKFISIVANTAIDSRPAIGILPVDDASDPDVAQIYERIIRQIEYISNAAYTYSRALEHAVAGGFGYWRILTRYCGDSFDQEIYLEPIENPLSSYLDEDGMYAFIRTSLNKKEFKRRYPDATTPQVNSGPLSDGYALWADTQKVYVSEYFWKEPVTKTLVQLVSPADGHIEVMSFSDKGPLESLKLEGWQVVRERTVETFQVKWAIITGVEVLELRDWPGKDIPLIEVSGDVQHVGDKIYKRSLIRDARDPQQMYNYWLTAQTEAIALIPKAPYLMTPEMIRGHEAMWNNANMENRTYLLYNQSGEKKPYREAPPQVQAGAMSMMQLADSDIKDVMGIYEPGLGDVSNERSGRAIKLRQQRSDLGTGHFQSQFKHALIKTGKQLIDLIPKIYDTQRVLRLRGEDETTALVQINHPVIDPVTRETVLLNDLSVGRYDIEATVRVYQTRREEATEMMIQALQYAPAVAPYILPLVFKYADWPGAKEVAEVIKNVLPQPGQPQPGPINGAANQPPSAMPMPGGM